MCSLCFIAYFKMALFFRLYIFREINLDNYVYVFNCPYSFRPQSRLNNLDILYYGIDLCVKKDNISTILLILLFELESIHYDLEH